MNILNKILPAHQPEVGGQRDPLLKLQETILRVSLFLMILLIAAFFALFIVASQPGENGLGIFFFSLVLAVTLWASLRSHLPYRVRAYFLLGLLYSASVWSILQTNQNRTAQLLLLAFSIYGTILFNRRAAIAGVVISSLTVLAAESLTLSLTPPFITAQTGGIISGLLTTVVYALIAGGLVFSLSYWAASFRRDILSQSIAMDEIEHTRADMEKTFAAQSQNLDRRLNQLKVVSKINHSIATQVFSEEMLQNVVDLMADTLELYYAGIFLIEPSRQYAVLRAGSGIAGRRMLANAHRLPIGGLSMIGWCVANQQPRIALNVQNESTRYVNPNLPETQSELALPILGPTRILGAMSIQSTDAEAFDDTDIAIFQSIADSIGVALENGDLLEKSRKDFQEISLLTRGYIQSAWQEELAIHGKLEYQYTNPAFSPSNWVGRHKMDVPVNLRGQRIGNLKITTAAAPSNEDVTFIHEIVSQMAISLESARLLEETQRAAAQQQKVNELSAHLAKAPRINDILQIAVRELGQLAAVDEVFIQLSHPNLTSQLDGNAAEEELIL